MKKTKRSARLGFTLVELMLVLVVIGVLVTLASNSFLRARIQTNETSALASLRIISSAAQSYRMNEGTDSYPDSLADLGQTNPKYIDDVLASGRKQGYSFNYTKTGPESFTCVAQPRFRNLTGVRSFSVDQSGLIVDEAGNPV